MTVLTKIYILVRADGVLCTGSNEVVGPGRDTTLSALKARMERYNAADSIVHDWAPYRIVSFLEMPDDSDDGTS